MNENNILDDLEDLPKLYSKTGIFLISIFLVFFAALAYARNLRTIGKSGMSLFVVIGILIYFQLGIKFLSFINISFLLDFILINLIGGLIITQVLWPSQIGDIRYDSKPIWPFLLVIFVITGVLVLLNVAIL